MTTVTLVARRLIPLAIAAAAAILLSACEGGDDTTASPEPPAAPPETDAPASTERRQLAWEQAQSVVAESLEEARHLLSAGEAFLDEPSDESLQAAREAWRRTHLALAEFELFWSLARVAPDHFTPLAEYHFAIDAWPIQPGYLDYFDVYSHSGIVNDISLSMDAETLRQQHGLTDDSEVVLGLHALEYLLWGEAGERPVADYQQAQVTQEQAASELGAADLPNNRRRTLLRLLAQLLVDDLEALNDSLSRDQGLLRSGYLARDAGDRDQLLTEAARDLLENLGDRLTADSEAAVHSAYAGMDPRLMAQNLAGVRQALFPNEGESDHPQPARDLTALQERLQEWEASGESWPPEPEQGEAMATELSELADALDAPAENP